MYQQIATPAVLLEMDIVERNIRRMVDTARRYGIAHRPHTKVHKSAELAKLQLRLGATGITCAKLGEAEVMADHGLDDILIAYPLIGSDKWERYGRLASRVGTLRTLVNSTTGAEGLSQTGCRLGRRLEVLIEIDGGTRRGGLLPGEPVLDFARSISHLPGIDIVGLLYYPGAIYAEHTEEGIIRGVQREHDDLVGTAELLRKNGFSMDILSGGNTVSSKRPQYLEGITEVRAGNYIFNDCAQLYYDQVTEEDCALRILATVVCRPDSHSAILDAGTKSLSSDFYPNTSFGYGRIAGRPEIKIWNLNEEHAFLRSQSPLDLEIGDKVLIIPNHACVVPNLFTDMYCVRNGTIERTIPVDARARSV